MKKGSPTWASLNSFEYMLEMCGTYRLPRRGEGSAADRASAARVHPDTGRKSLFVTMYTKRIIGMPERKAASCWTLLAHATQPQFVFTVKWRPKDFVFWDNRSLVHRAIANYDMTKHRRMLQRVGGAARRRTDRRRIRRASGGCSDDRADKFRHRVGRAVRGRWRGRPLRLRELPQGHVGSARSRRLRHRRRGLSDRHRPGPGGARPPAPAADNFIRRAAQAAHRPGRHRGLRPRPEAARLGCRRRSSWSC